MSMIRIQDNSYESESMGKDLGNADPACKAWASPRFTTSILLRLFNLDFSEDVVGKSLVSLALSLFSVFA